MTIFEDLEESVLKTFNSSGKESLLDIGIDDEERDKIQNIISSSYSADLNVDYSDFSNHVYFGSAYAAVQFAAERVIQFPFDGELKEKNEWRNTNSPYENWFFDNFPKQQGYLQLSTGSVATYPYVDDHRGLLSPNSGSNILGSYCVEMVVRPYTGLASNTNAPLYSYINATNRGHYGQLRNIGGSKYIQFDHIDEAGSTNSVSCSYDSYLDSSHMISYVWNSLINSGTIYIDGAPVAVSGTSTSFISCSMSGAVLKVGHYSGATFSGAIDDFRYWTNGSVPRSEELIKRNYYRPINGNLSGGLKLYWKFNQVSEYGSKVLDQSGYELHGTFTGSFTFASNIISGTLGSWFKDGGDPIISLSNTRVDSFISTQRTSGSVFDDENSNLIFNLVPSFFTDDEGDTEFQKLFLLLTARHFDRLKLYIEHISNVVKMQKEKYDGPPSNLLDIAAKHYGIDIGDVYSGADALQFYFGENVYSSGSMTDSLSVVKDVVKRNIVSNLIHLIKTKSTQEAIKSVLHAVGLNENIVSINEFTDFSGGISTTFSPKTIEQRVLTFLTSSNVYIDTRDFSFRSGSIFQVRTLFDSSSVSLTQSIFNYSLDGINRFYAQVERQNLTSSSGRLMLTALSSNLTPVTLSSSFLPIFDNEWINFSLYRKPEIDGGIGFYISSIDRGGLIFSSSAGQAVQLDFSSSGIASMYLGSSGSNKFNGYMQEFRGWSAASSSAFMSYMSPLVGQVYYRYAHDWALTEVDEFQNISNLKVHLKMNDFTGSASGIGEIHNWVEGSTGSYYSGLSSSENFNFPGKYITKFDVPTSYDLNVDNDKIRIKDQSTFTKNDQNLDIPFVSIDFSPITPLNKEVIRWIGDISKFSNISADPMFDYREENLNLRYLRQTLFEKRFNSKINFSAFFELIKWFDNNFAYLLSQFIPLDMAYSLSSFVIEPHILEHNKIRKVPSFGSVGGMRTLETTISLRPELVADNPGDGASFGDPGRFGAFVSASGEASKDIRLSYTSSSNGINEGRNYEVAIIKNNLINNVESQSPRNYGNAYYTRIITGSNYLKNVLNLVEDFNLTGVYSVEYSSPGSLYMTSSHGTPERSSMSTASFIGVQDARWLWMQTRSSGAFNNILYDDYFPVTGSPAIPSQNRRNFLHNYGVGYGGMWGQLLKVHEKSTNGVPKFVSHNYDPVVGQPAFGLGYWIGNFYSKTGLNFSNYIEVFNDDALSTKILWPTKNSHNGVFFKLSASVALDTANNLIGGFGPSINIEKYNSLVLEILGKTQDYELNLPQTSFSASFQIKFQFFSRETPGDKAFESVLSSSKEGANYSIDNSPVIYYLKTPSFSVLNSSSPQTFQLSLQRKLPQQKYMRISLVSSIEGTAKAPMFITVKGIFSEKDIDDDSIPERKV